MRRLSSWLFIVALLLLVALVLFPVFRRWLLNLLNSVKDLLGAVGRALLSAITTFGFGIGLGGGPDQTGGVGRSDIKGAIRTGKPPAGNSPAAPATGGGTGAAAPHPCGAHGGVAWELYDLGVGASPRYRWVRPGTYSGPGQFTGHYTCADGWDTVREAYGRKPSVEDPCSASGSWAIEHLGGNRYRCGDGTVKETR